MSAIAGIVHMNGQQALWEDSWRLYASLGHIPADTTGVWKGDGAFLSCHAQWITPESVYERLPLYDEESKLTITADAILDNREQLAEQLRISRSALVAMADSELILLAYQRWGEEVATHLLGDFVFAIWDERRRTLFAARDITGMRTLYYRLDGPRFAFCTLMKPLLELEGVQKSLDETWLSDFLAIPDMLDTANIHATVYRGINQLPSAHTLTFRSGKVEMKQYHRWDNVEPLRLRSDDEYIEAFRDVFSQAVGARLRTHRQVAAALSGGLDSGSVVGFASGTLRSQGKQLHAYSYVPVPDFTDYTSKTLLADERPFIQSTVSHVGNISENYLDFEGRSPLSEVDTWLNMLEMPYKYFENSFWIRGFYEKASEQDAGVLLTGARGNFTISWGPALDYYASLLKSGRYFRWFREMQQYSERTGMALSRIARITGRKAFPQWFQTKNKGAAPALGAPLIHPDFAAKTGVLDRLGSIIVQQGGAQANALKVRADKFNNLAIANKNGTVATKCSLRYRAWERDPTSDPRVIQFCLAVPIEQYVRQGTDRSLIRRAASPELPDKVRLNQRVRGVQPADWLHRILPDWEAFTSELRTLCSDSQVAGILNTDRISTALSNLPSPRPELASHPDLRLMMHSLIVYRFIRRF
ncbi:asparagine synthase-related protein [Paenibacillus silvae]|uniref:asparagine synthase-related protein n=1 Tax=Paenibacillus silvae TaxID=1325358 RepID=UPI002002A1D9|nr:asparagine synthase-related protein [Paenibacillus silvae]MCK6074409.1 asparagine synthetase B [Paenibacillus silvae]MCK6148113.1 asparagine synthetase B [Paenibacillus silvae]MCK6266413.1 asparagine synthetase B [Paenibacillus silvae]